MPVSPKVDCGLDRLPPIAVKFLRRKGEAGFGSLRRAGGKTMACGWSAQVHGAVTAQGTD